ncbi:hypothetical protein KAW80_01870 [Candidatus Babeliales bacterium]|nr:hypothetical protein [Candidatus Babeliales bacterium]
MKEQPSVTKSFNILSDPLATDINKNNALKKVGALFHKTDSYAPIEETTTDDGNIETEGHI